MRSLQAPRTEGPRTFVLSGLTPTAKAVCVALFWKVLRQPLIVITPSSQHAEPLVDHIRTFASVLSPDAAQVLPLPALDALPGQGLSPHAEIQQQRAWALWNLARGRAAVIVAPVEAALYRVWEPDYYRQLALLIRVGDELGLESVVDYLEAVGYQPREPVEMVGEYSVRGGILDVYSPGSSRPLRIEFLDDSVESLRYFDPGTQRSVERIQECCLLPLTEIVRTRELVMELSERIGNSAEERLPEGWEFWVPLVKPRECWLGDFEHRYLVIDEPGDLQATAERFWKRLRQHSARISCPAELNFLTAEEFSQRIAESDKIWLQELELGSVDAPSLGRRSFWMRSQPVPSFQGRVPQAVEEVKKLAEEGWRLVVFAPSAGEIERLADIFTEYGLPHQLTVEVGEVPERVAQRPYAGLDAPLLLAKGRLRRGVLLPEVRLALIGIEDLFGPLDLALPARLPRTDLSAFARELADLHPGDYVVHETHGIGKFLGVRELVHDGQPGEFVVLEYADGAKLYVPVTSLNLIQKYRGTGEAKPPLDRLGGVTWERTKKRVKARMRDLAEKLLRLYAERELAEGFAFSPDGPWQREFEEAFEYEETPDQLTAIREIKRDMESPRPMDRLLCGDVGYGKTEVAMRAAFKAIADGKQVAVLAPTTVLCLQHYETFQRRFAPFPVRVEMLSRLRTPRQIKQILEDLAEGKIDIIIGTHRLLSKDVRFRDLGLLIIDEEQRFGVRHKEHLKELRKSIDVLTMTATPIPRTLHMALVGLRDLSVIQTPPKDRLAIHTVVARFDPQLVRSAIEQELARGGQIYYLHNRVETIWSRAAFLKELVPECRLAVAHGQMAESALEKVLLGFMRHEFDMLVCTTIVENGLDIPLANTIIVENAHRYGLAELYQLRGRVGRSNRRAYAYLLVPEDAELSEAARKRLAALREFSELGSGFKVAALDLELRGAGNLLGAEQHGHINAVGFEMYMRLLEQTIQELRGRPVPAELHTSFQLGLDIRIPQDYVSDEHQRLRVYKRIAELKDEAEAKDLLEELADRYGPVPEPVRQLVRLALLKSRAEYLGIERVQLQRSLLSLKFHPSTRATPEGLMELVHTWPGAQFTPDGVLKLPLAAGATREAILGTLERCLNQLLATPTPS